MRHDELESIITHCFKNVVSAQFECIRNYGLIFTGQARDFSNTVKYEEPNFLCEYIKYDLILASKAISYTLTLNSSFAILLSFYSEVAGRYLSSN